MKSLVRDLVLERGHRKIQDVSTRKGEYITFFVVDSYSPAAPGNRWHRTWWFSSGVTIMGSILEQTFMRLGHRR